MQSSSRRRRHTVGHIHEVDDQAALDLACGPITISPNNYI